jgi:hypothetical protein
MTLPDRTLLAAARLPLESQDAAESPADICHRGGRELAASVPRSLLSKVTRAVT